MRTSTSVRSTQQASVYVVTGVLLDSLDAPPRVARIGLLTLNRFKEHATINDCTTRTSIHWAAFASPAL